MPDEKIKLIDSLGQEYTFPKTFELRSEPIAKKSSIMDVAFAHGAKDVSDGCFSQRVIEISGRIWATSNSEYNSKWDAIAEHLVKEDFKIQNRGRRINIKKILDISHEYPSTVNYPFGVVTIRMLALDPFWYSTTESEFQKTITSSPTQFTIDVGGKAETYPLIIFKNNANNSSFKLENKSDSRQFTIQDSLNTQGTVVTVDCAAGRVKRGDTNIISKFSGLFLRLLPAQTNTLEYTGANVDLTIKYYEAWI